MRRHMKVHSEQGGAEMDPEREEEEGEGEGVVSETSGSPPIRPHGSRSSI
jgi:hypothetical protein